MDNKFSNIKERILYLIDIKGYKKECFFKELGMSYGNFKGENKKRPLNSNTLADVLTLIPDVNAEWLLTGKGEILKLEENLIAAEPKASYHSISFTQLKAKVDQQEKTIQEHSKKIEQLQKVLEKLIK